MSFNNFLQLSIFGSILFSIFSRFSNEDICYTCDNQITALLLALHFILLLTTFQKKPFIKMLALTMLIFFVSRLGIVQLNLDYFTYRNFLPNVLQMREVLYVLFLVILSLLAGCFFGERIRFKKSESYRLLWASSVRDETIYYYYLTAIYILTTLVLIYLTFSYKYSPTMDHRLFDHSILIIAKIARTFSFLAPLSIAWLILRNPRGFQRRITIFAIILFVFSSLLTGSKVALISAILPFVCVYYVARVPIPQKKIILFISVIFISILMYPVFGALRTFLTMTLMSNPDVYSHMAYMPTPHRAIPEIDLVKIFYSISNRVGSSFDVVSFVFSTKHLFVPYVNLMAEFLDVANGFYPGEIFKVDAPQWAQILPSLGYSSGFKLQTEIGTGENLGLIPHLFINFGIFGLCFWSFFVTFLYSISYNFFNIFIRVTILFWILLNISNGSGFVKMIIDIPILLFFLLFLRVTYRIFRPLIIVILKSIPKTIQINSQLGSKES